jgi:Bacterial regulatory proteins, luxR family
VRERAPPVGGDAGGDSDGGGWDCDEGIPASAIRRGGPSLDDALLPLLLPSLLSIEEIAEDLSISVNTVKSHLRAVYLKLGVGGRRAAAVTTHERELVRTGRYMAR